MTVKRTLQAVLVLALTALFVAITIKVFFDPVPVPGAGGTVAAYGTAAVLLTTAGNIIKRWACSHDGHS